MRVVPVHINSFVTNKPVAVRFPTVLEFWSFGFVEGRKLKKKAKTNQTKDEN